MRCIVQARVAKYIAPEEEWLRLLQVELTPVLAFLRSNDLPSSAPYKLENLQFYLLA